MPLIEGGRIVEDRYVRVDDDAPDSRIARL